MADIAPGTYTIGDIVGLVDFDLDAETTVTYESSGTHPDYRRVTVGGLPVSGADDVLVVPDTTDTLEITLDGAVVHTLTVKS